MSICKNWEPFSLSRRPGYIYLGWKNTVFPPLPFLFLWSRSWGVLTWPLLEAQPHSWLCRGDISSLTEALVQLLAESSRNMDLCEGWKTDNTSTMWRLSVHPCDQVASLPASTCPSQSQSKHGVIPKPRKETDGQQMTVGLGLLHITVAHLCFVSCGKQV